MPGEDIYSWSTTAIQNGSADTGITWVEGQARASVNNSARSEMAAHAKFRNLITGAITTTGSANAQAFVSGVGYTVVPTGLRALLQLGFTNTGPVTLNMDGIGAVAVKDTLGNELAANSLPEGGFGEFCYDGTDWILLNSPAITVASLTPGGGGSGSGITVGVRRGYIDGLPLSYLSATEITVGPGEAADSTNARMINLASSITKTTAAWAVGTNQGGLDTGTILPNAWYHVFLIQRSDTGVRDILFSTSVSAPTMPAGYDFKRRIGSCLTIASQFVDFFQIGDFFTWQKQKEDGTTTSTSYITMTLSTPKDVQTIARLSITGSSPADAQGYFAMVTPGMSETVQTVSANVWNGTVAVAALHVVTGFASDVRVKATTFGSYINWTIRTTGWLDPRGRDN